MKSGNSMLYLLACILSPSSYLWDGGIFWLPHTPDYVAGISVSSVPQSEAAALVGVRQVALFRPYRVHWSSLTFVSFLL